jgi:hypothetical protein
MNGKLGDGRPLSASMAPQLTPVEVVGLTNVTDIAVGRNHTCAIVGGTERWCWGRNEHSQLGNEAAGSQSSVPVPVIGSTPKPPVVVTPPVVATPTLKPPVVTPKPAAPSILYSSSARRIGSSRTVTIATLVCPAGSTACTVTLPRTVTVTIKRKPYSFAVTAPRSVRAGRRASVRITLSRGAATRLQGRTATVKLGTTRKTVKQKITAPPPKRRR